MTEVTLSQNEPVSILKKFSRFLGQNIQIHQTIGLTTILTIGVVFYGLDISWLEIFTIFFCVIVFDGLIIRYETGRWIFPRAGVNAGFGISFFLRSEDLIIYFFAALIAILGKRLLRVDIQNANPYSGATHGRHFLNPSNSAVFFTLALFPYLAWSNPLQWGQLVDGNMAITILGYIIIVGLYIQSRLKKVINFPVLDVIIPVFLTHVLLFFTITQESWYSTRLFFNGGFFIFLFFQITDPKTVPETRLARLLYGVCIGIFFYILQYFINENYSLLTSLFVMTWMLPIIWKNEFKPWSKKLNRADVYLISFIVFLLIFLSTLIAIYGKPDLLFNNRCNQLFCRNDKIFFQ